MAQPVNKPQNPWGNVLNNKAALEKRLGPNGSKLGSQYAQKYGKKLVDKGSNYAGPAKGPVQGLANHVVENHADWYGQQFLAQMQSAAYGNDPQRFGEFLARRYDELFSLVAEASQNVKPEDHPDRASYVHAMQESLAAAYRRRMVATMMAVEESTHGFHQPQAYTEEQLKQRLQERLSQSYSASECEFMVEQFIGAWREVNPSLHGTRDSYTAALTKKMEDRCKNRGLPDDWKQELQVWAEGDYQHINTFIQTKISQLQDCFPEKARMLRGLLGLTNQAMNMAVVQDAVQGAIENNVGSTGSLVSRFLDRIKSAEVLVSPLEKIVEEVEKATDTQILGIHDEGPAGPYEIVWHVNQDGKRVKVAKAGSEAIKLGIRPNLGPNRVAELLAGKADKFKQRDMRIELGAYDVIYDCSYGVKIVRASGKKAHDMGIKKGMTEEEVQALHDAAKLKLPVNAAPLPELVSISFPTGNQAIIHEGKVQMVGRRLESMGIKPGMTEQKAKTIWTDERDVTSDADDLDAITVEAGELKKLQDYPSAEGVFEKLIVGLAKLPKTYEERVLNSMREGLNVQAGPITVPFGSVLAFGVQMGITAPVRKVTKGVWRYLMGGPSRKEFARSTARSIVDFVRSPMTEFCVMRLVSEGVNRLVENAQAAHKDDKTHDYEAMSVNKDRQVPGDVRAEGSPYFIGKMALHTFTNIRKVAAPSLEEASQSKTKRFLGWTVRRVGDLTDLGLRAANSTPVRAIAKVGTRALLASARYFTPEDQNPDRERTGMERFVEVTELTRDFVSRGLQLYGDSTNEGLICKATPALTIAALETLQKIEDQDTGLLPSISKKSPVFKFIHIRPEELEGGGGSKCALVHKAALVGIRSYMQVARANKVNRQVREPYNQFQEDKAWLESLLQQNVSNVNFGTNDQNRQMIIDRMERLIGQIDAMVIPDQVLGSNYQETLWDAALSLTFIDELTTPIEDGKGLPEFEREKVQHYMDFIVSSLKAVREACQEEVGSLAELDLLAKADRPGLMKLLKSGANLQDLDKVISDLENLALEKDVVERNLPAFALARRFLQVGYHVIEESPVKGQDLAQAEDKLRRQREEKTIILDTLKAFVNKVKTSPNTDNVTLADLKNGMLERMDFLNHDVADFYFAPVEKGEQKLRDRHQWQVEVEKDREELEGIKKAAREAMVARNELVEAEIAKAEIQQKADDEDEQLKVDDSLVVGAQALGNAVNNVVCAFDWFKSCFAKPAAKEQKVDYGQAFGNGVKQAENYIGIGAQAVGEFVGWQNGAETQQQKEDNRRLHLQNIVARDHYRTSKLDEADKIVAKRLYDLGQAQKKLKEAEYRLEVLKRQDPFWWLDEATAFERWHVVEVKLQDHLEKEKAKEDDVQIDI